MKLHLFQKERSYEYFSDFFGKQYYKFVVCVSHIVYLLIGIIMGWTSPVLSKLGDTEDNPLGNPISPNEMDLIGSLMYLAAASGPILFIPASEYFGKRNLLVIVSFIVPITFGIILFAEVVELYYVCRVFQGIFMGASLSVLPVYLAEILADKDRDFYMSLGTIFGISGVVIAYAIGPFIPLLYFNSGITVFSFVFLVLFVFGCPNTPYHVMMTEGTTATNELLTLLRTEFDEKEADKIKNVLENEVRGSFLDLFKSVENLKLCMKATIPLLLQQFCGITLLLSYSELIFKETGIAIRPALCSLILAGFKITTCFLTPVLLKTDKFSIRTLMVFNLTGMALCNFLLTFYFMVLTDTPSLNWLPLLGLVLFIPFYNCGMDPIPWVLLGQIYPKNINAVGTAVSTSMFFVASFPALFLFSKVSLSFLYLFSACSCCLGIPYFLFLFTEPKNV